ncbi:MAG: elongation factor, partial [Planctomycetota bacterium]
FADAFAKARPVLLEPVMRMQIHVPERCTGDVAASLSGMRGRLLGMSTDADAQHIESEAPLASLLDFATQLRSMTAGEGSFRMEFDRYEQVPAAIQAEIVKQRRAAVEAAHAAHQQA